MPDLCWRSVARIAFIGSLAWQAGPAHGFDVGSEDAAEQQQLTPGALSSAEHDADHMHGSANDGVPSELHEDANANESNAVRRDLEAAEDSLNFVGGDANSNANRLDLAASASVSTLNEQCDEDSHQAPAPPIDTAGIIEASLTADARVTLDHASVLEAPADMRIDHAVVEAEPESALPPPQGNDDGGAPSGQESNGAPPSPSTTEPAPVEGVAPSPSAQIDQDEPPQQPATLRNADAAGTEGAPPASSVDSPAAERQEERVAQAQEPSTDESDATVEATPSPVFSAPSDTEAAVIESDGRSSSDDSTSPVIELQHRDAQTDGTAPPVESAAVGGALEGHVHSEAQQSVPPTDERSSPDAIDAAAAAGERIDPASVEGSQPGNSADPVAVEVGAPLQPQPTNAPAASTPAACEPVQPQPQPLLTTLLGVAPSQLEALWRDLPSNLVSAFWLSLLAGLHFLVCLLLYLAPKTVFDYFASASRMELVAWELGVAAAVAGALYMHPSVWLVAAMGGAAGLVTLLMRL